MVQIGVYCRPQHRWAHYDRHENGTPMGYCTIKAKRPDRLRYDPQEWSCQPQARTRRPAGLPCPAHNGEARIHGGASSSVDSRLRRVKCSRKYSGKRNPIGASLPRRQETIRPRVNHPVERPLCSLKEVICNLAGLDISGT